MQSRNASAYFNNIYCILNVSVGLQNICFECHKRRIRKVIGQLLVVTSKNFMYMASFCLFDYQKMVKNWRGIVGVNVVL